jgi:hypothetical protein
MARRPQRKARGGMDSSVRNLFGSKSQGPAPVTDNEAPVGPSAPKSKPANATPKHPAVAERRALIPIRPSGERSRRVTKLQLLSYPSLRRSDRQALSR